MDNVVMCQNMIRNISEKWGNIYIPEFTFKDYRIDAAIIDIKTRWIRGYEIKVNRSDFLRDEKWQMYSQFLSSLSIVCPSGLIEKHEVPDPFGLMYVDGMIYQWIKRPKNFQKRGGIAWTWTYLSVLEKEMPRLQFEIHQLSHEIQRLKRLEVKSLNTYKLVEVCPSE